MEIDFEGCRWQENRIEMQTNIEKIFFIEFHDIFLHFSCHHSRFSCHLINSKVFPNTFKSFLNCRKKAGDNFRYLTYLFLVRRGSEMQVLSLNRYRLLTVMLVLHFLSLLTVLMRYRINEYASVFLTSITFFSKP